MIRAPAMSESDETAALRAENARLREAPEPFAEYAEWVATNRPGWDHDLFSFHIDFPGSLFSMRAFRQARDAFLSARP